MNNAGKLTLAVLLLLAVAATAYWFGTRATTAVTETGSVANPERKVLYYRNPMGLPDTSPTPKRDAMGMDYVPVYEGEDEVAGQLSISIAKVQKLGVKSEAAAMRELNRELRVTGRIEVNERRTYTIAPKFEGWVERLFVNTTGQLVSKGQPLFEVYSPELISAQRELALATRGLASLKDADSEAQAGMRQLVESSRARLQNWGMAEGEHAVSVNGEVRPRVTFHAPATGVVLEKKAVQGMRFMPGEVLYQIADLSSVWIIAEVNEQDIAKVKLNNRAQAMVDAYPDRTFDGKVDFIYPTLNSSTRTVQVRMEIANPKGLLKPAMFANTQIETDQGGKMLTVPVSAVIDSGTRQVVLVRLAEGRFEPRMVSLGDRSNDYVEIKSGIAEGELVVTSANFLIDAESNLKAALSGLAAQVTHSDSTVTERNPVMAAKGDQPAHDVPAQQQAKKSRSVGHQAQGMLDAINEDGSVSITHDPITSLGWPGMTMDFNLANSALAAGIEPGSEVSFEIVERAPGKWVITRLKAKPAQHEGH
jgi:Cu(I)/Ag(I) efflux system membrane fusion protein